MIQNPLVVILTSLIAGILAGESGVNPIWSALPVGGGILSYLLMSYASRSRRRKLRLARFHPLWIALLFGGIGMFSDSLALPTDIPDQTGRRVRMSGRVEEVTSTNMGERILLDISHIASADPTSALRCYGKEGKRVRMKAYVHSRGSRVARGELVELPATLQALDPADSIFGGMNRMLRRKGILYRTFVSPADILATGRRTGISDLASEWRARLEDCIIASTLSYPTKKFLISLTLGDKDFLSDKDRQEFADAGVAHILAVSGMHVGIVASIVLLLLYPVNFAGGYKWRYGLSIPAVWLFVWLSGMAPGTVRAGIMISFYLGSLILERRHSPLRALGWAAVIILVISPRSIYDVGFQLSFLCVGSLILFVRPLNTVNQRTHPKLYRLNGLLLVTLVASISSWIVSSYYFHQISLLFLPANLIAVPLLPFFVGIFALYLLLWSLGVPAVWLGKIIDGGYELFCRLIASVSEQHAMVTDLSVGLPTVLLWLAALLMAAISLHSQNKKRRRYNLIISLALVVSTVVSIPFFCEKQSVNGDVVTPAGQSVPARSSHLPSATSRSVMPSEKYSIKGASPSKGMVSHPLTYPC